MLIGAEALVRMRRVDGTLAAPGEFLPHVRALGLDACLSQWVLQVALDDFAHLPPDLSVAVNLSPSVLTEDVHVRALCHAVRNSSLPPATVTLEVTEDEPLQRSALPNLALLRESGVTVSLDDFGDGHAGVQSLCWLEPNELKLARSLIRELELPRGRAVCQSIVKLAHEMGIAVLAEGVETAAQLEVAHAIGCVRGQGYYFAKPETFDAFARRCNAPSTVEAAAA
jgi:EAL domain-containing protein (putative c-di-GMP-specific phosphodiesterase class I)